MWIVKVCIWSQPNVRIGRPLEVFYRFESLVRAQDWRNAYLRICKEYEVDNLIVANTPVQE